MRKTTVVFVAITVTFAALVVALSAAEAGATTTLCLDISGITGGSHVMGHTGWIDIDSVQWGVSSTAGSGTGGGSAKPSFSDVLWTQLVDTSTPPLFTDIATGKRISDAKVDFVAPIGESLRTYFEMDFHNDFLTSLNLSGTSGAQPTVTGSFDYQQITMTYYEYGPDGSPSGTVSASYNLTRGGSVAALANVYALGLSGPSAASTVPTPATLWLLGPGLAGLAAVRTRFKK